MLHLPELQNLNRDWRASPSANNEPYSPKGQFILVIHTPGQGQTYKGSTGPILHDRHSLGDGWENFDDALRAATHLQGCVAIGTKISVDRR